MNSVLYYAYQISACFFFSWIGSKYFYRKGNAKLKKEGDLIRKQKDELLEAQREFLGDDQKFLTVLLMNIEMIKLLK